MEYSFATDCKVVVAAKKKGGAGASLTTLMTALAYTYLHPDHTVLIICADETTYTLSSYRARLRQQFPDLKLPFEFRQWKSSSGILLTDFTIDKAQELAADAVFLDFPPRDDVLKENIGIANLVVIPTNVEGADAEKAPEVKNLATQERKLHIVLLNRMAREREGKARIWREQFEKVEKMTVSIVEVKAHSMYGDILARLDERSHEVKVKLPNAEDGELGVYFDFGIQVCVMIGRPSTRRLPQRQPEPAQDLQGVPA